MQRPEAQSYEDGKEIRVNITDQNSSILLTFETERDYRAFCKEVSNLARTPTEEASEDG